MTAQKRQMSEQAKAAKMIKSYAHSLGLKCSVRSASFSMGDSVNYEVENVAPDLYADLKAYAGQFQYGSFDGMEDIYNMTNSRSDLPQSKFVSGRNRFTDEYYQKAWDLLRVSAANGDDKPVDYIAAQDLYWYDNGSNYEHKIACIVYQVLNGAQYGPEKALSVVFWDKVKRETQKAAPVTKQASAVAGGLTCEVQSHTHTKKGFDFYIVVLSSRVAAEQFADLLSECKAQGGWYSRKWGTSPAGFAFKDQDNAEQFAAYISGADGVPPSPTGGQPVADKPRAADGEKLRKLADGFQSAIDKAFADRETNTPKRLAQAMNARAEGERQKRAQAGLFALADLADAGSVPELLADVKTKSRAYDLAGSKKEPVPNGYHSYYVETGEPVDQDPARLAFWELLKPKSAEQINAENIEKALNDLKFNNIPGYFPTPDAVIDMMLDLAGIESGHVVLDPSAGHGAILDRVRDISNSVQAVEFNGPLSEILNMKGIDGHRATDFLTLSAGDFPPVDRVLMNPPFEKLQDVDHVLHAFDILKPGGRLVGIMSPSAFYRDDKKSVAFREFFDENGGQVLDIMAGAFKSSGTMIATKLILLDK